VDAGDPHTARRIRLMQTAQRLATKCPLTRENRDKKESMPYTIAFTQHCGKDRRFPQCGHNESITWQSQVH